MLTRTKVFDLLIVILFILASMLGAPATATPRTRASKIGAGASSDQINGLSYPIYPLLSTANSKSNSTSTHGDYVSAGNGWAVKSPMPTGRAYMAVAVFDGRIYAIGGYDDSSGDEVSLSTLEIYDLATDSWSVGTPMPAPKWHACAAVIGNRIYVVGDDNRLFSYDPSNDTWNEHSPMPVDAGHCAVAAVNGKLYVARGGGEYPSGEYWTYSYDPSTDTWTSKAPLPYHRSIAGFANVDGKLYAIGGGDPSLAPGPTEVTRVDIYDPATDSWELDVTARMPTRRTHLGSTIPVVDGKIYVIGGWNGYTALSTVEVYDPSADSWSTETPMPTARYGLAWAVANNKLYAIGGNWGGSGGHPQSANEELRLPTEGCPPDLSLFDPEVDGCTAALNGVVTSPCGDPVQRINWNWDDGTSNDSWFAASHTYGQSGAYEATVTAYTAAGYTTTDTKLVNITNCGDGKPPSGSDLVVLQIDRDPDSPLVGDHVHFIVDVSNQGNSDTSSWGQVGVALFVDGNSIGDDYESNIAPDRSQFFNFYWWAGPGCHTIRAVADSGDFISESNEDNNEREQTLCVTTPSGLEGRIAFSSNRDGNWEIYTMSADGSDQARLTNNSAEDNFPDWSPDGSRIVFASDRDGNFEIYVMNADGTNQKRLTSSPADNLWPAWSPDGAKIAFTSDRDGNEEIYVMNADGSDQTRLTRNSARDYLPDWSPDSERIAFTTDRDGNEEVYLMDANGTSQANLTDNPASDSAPDWSPDGSRIAFDTNRGDGYWRISHVKTNGSEMRNETFTANDIMPVWSPDGNKMAFASDRAGNWDIYVTQTGTRMPMLNMTRHSAHDRWPSWSRSPQEDVVVGDPCPSGCRVVGVVTETGHWDYHKEYGSDVDYAEVAVDEVFLGDLPHSYCNNHLTVLYDAQAVNVGVGDRVEVLGFSAFFGHCVLTGAWDPQGYIRVIATLQPDAQLKALADEALAAMDAVEQSGLETEMQRLDEFRGQTDASAAAGLIVNILDVLATRIPGGEVMESWIVRIIVPQLAELGLEMGLGELIDERGFQETYQASVLSLIQEGRTQVDANLGRAGSVPEVSENLHSYIADVSTYYEFVEWRHSILHRDVTETLDAYQEKRLDRQVVWLLPRLTLGVLNPPAGVAIVVSAVSGAFQYSVDKDEVQALIPPVMVHFEEVTRDVASIPRALSDVVDRAMERAGAPSMAVSAVGADREGVGVSVTNDHDEPVAVHAFASVQLGSRTLWDYLQSETTYYYIPCPYFDLQVVSHRAQLEPGEQREFDLHFTEEVDNWVEEVQRFANETGETVTIDGFSEVYILYTDSVDESTPYLAARKAEPGAETKWVIQPEREAGVETLPFEGNRASMPGKIGQDDFQSYEIAIDQDLDSVNWTLTYPGSDLDLHVLDPEGQHVGMSYETGETEVQIHDAEYSGPDANPEWVKVSTPAPGEWRVTVVGIQVDDEEEPFSLDVSQEGESGILQPWMFICTAILVLMLVATAVILTVGILAFRRRP